MSVEIRVPPLGESVVEATVGQWTKAQGDSVRKDEILVELETDKITVEVTAPSDGVLGQITKSEGDTVQINELLGVLEPSGAAAQPAAEPAAAAPAPAPAVTAAAAPPARAPEGVQSSPTARAVAAEQGIDLSEVRGTGPNERITKEDVLRAVEARSGAPAAAPAAPAPRPTTAPAPAAPAPAAPAPRAEERQTRQRMSRRRQTIARRLVESQQTTASLTTFNEVDLSRIFELRKRRQDSFVKKHGLKLGFMSFFTKAAIGALKQFPLLNAEIDGDEIIEKHFYDIGIAVGTEQGLVVPVIRDADRKSFAQIEQGITELALRARDGKLTLDDLQGGTFTITNGGIFGSMLSTPILNPPQVGILGMHNIVERPVVVEGKIEIRPIMYLALTYDHRIVDGSEAVRFLVAIKQMIEDPEMLLIEG